MFNVTYEVDTRNEIASEPKVGCNRCRCGEGEHVRCYHHPDSRFAVQTYLYFKNLWDGKVCGTAAIQ